MPGSAERSRRALCEPRLCLGHKPRFLQTPFDPGVAARATRALVSVMEVFDAPAHVSATILVGGKFGRVTVRNSRPSITRTTLLRAAKVGGFNSEVQLL